ncbi:septal ring lytic transglycosylase RlpA family protein [bacterium]|nr:MAG: septal ring lytic transglycosylase RlpA family protein [bacterium]
MSGISKFRNTGLITIAIFVGLCSFLSGCGSAPAPKASKRDTYVVHGKRYRVLGSSKGYVQKGKASWYGPNFHGRLTANGETYDMEALTAAHRTLPLGTYVKVKRVDGGQEIVVRINDRGPFVKGRIIDLSKAGARHLDMLDEGVAEVTVRALGSREGRSSSDEVLLTPRQDYGQGVFSIQVGAFTVKDNARRLARQMKMEYGEADVSLYDRGDMKFFRVRVGRFHTEQEAEQFKDGLLDRGEFEAAFVVAR